VDVAQCSWTLLESAKCQLCYPKQFPSGASDAVNGIPWPGGAAAEDRPPSGLGRMSNSYVALSMVSIPLTNVRKRPVAYILHRGQASSSLPAKE